MRSLTVAPGQMSKGSPATVPPGVFPAPEVGPFTSHVSYLYHWAVSTFAMVASASRPELLFTNRTVARLSVQPSDGLVAEFTGKIEAERYVAVCGAFAGRYAVESTLSVTAK